MKIHPGGQMLPALALLFATLLPAAQTAAEQADNFTLLDQHGDAVELHYYDHAPAVVLMAHRNDSDVVRASAGMLETVRDHHPDIPVFLINSVEGEDRDAVRRDSKQQELDFSVLMDRTRLVAETLELDYAGEALVIDPRRWEIIYRGPVTDRPHSADGPNYIAEAVDAHLSGDAIANASRSMPESFGPEERIDLPGSDGEAISYSDTIAPMLKEKCADCHRPGGIAPWAMTNHAVVQGFSPMIRETVLTRRMPPWHADPEIGHFRDDMSLSVEQKRQLVQWIDAGAPRGEGPDPLTGVEASTTQWQMGEPDLVVDLPAFEVPATGVLDYQNFEVENPLDRDVWVKAVQIVPGDRQVVHHAIATYGPGTNGNTPTDSGTALSQSQLMTFVPGNETYDYPEGTGVHIPADSSFFTQMHYTTYGQETTDQTKIGLYFAEEPPEHVLQHYAIVDLGLDIPAGAADHEEVAYHQFRRDAVIYSLFPHAHYRGRASSFALRYPDGREEMVLSVPDYDFNWQRYYQLEEPLEVPAGTMVVHRTRYDNSVNNESNPDPEIEVGFGEQTWDEMLYGGISYRYADSAAEQAGESGETTTSLAIGFMDRNMDGKVSLDEMPEDSRESLALPFQILDKDKSGGLEFEEFRQLIGRENGGSIIRSAL